MSGPLRDRLLQFVNDDLLAGFDVEVGADDEIVLNGVVDSLGVARIVGYIEGELGIAVPAEEVTIDHFRSVSVLAQYLEQRADGD